MNRKTRTMTRRLRQEDKNDNSPLAVFFSGYSYSGFIYDPTRPVIDEFHQLCGVLGMDPNDKDDPEVKQWA